MRCKESQKMFPVYWRPGTTNLADGLWTHEWGPICFSLVVDDFGVKYVDEEHAAHLVSALKKIFEITVDTEGEK